MEPKAQETTTDTATCLNCGSICRENYCPRCGQPAQTPQRITMKTFWKGVALSFARMTPGFWSTFVGLLIHPWVVIREYLRGKRVKYSPPVTMVIQLLLYSTFIYTVLGHILDIDFFSMYSGGKTEEETGNWLLDLILSSDVLFKILIACSIAINCYVAYRNKGRRRYSFYEFLTAAIYMGCCFSIYNNLLRPLDLIGPAVGTCVKIGVALIIGTVTLFKAFPMTPWWRKWLTWLWFLTLNILYAAAILVLFTMIYIIRHPEMLEPA